MESKIFEGNIWDIVFSWFCALFALFTIYTAGFAVLPPLLLRATHVGFVLVIIFLERKKERKIKIWKVIFAVFSVASIVYLWRSYDYLVTRFQWVTPLKPAEIFFGIILVSLVIIATWIKVGKTLSILTMIFISYLLFGNYLPGVIRHSGNSLTAILDQLYLSTEGIFGIPVGVSARYIVLFIIFGAFLKECGAADWFLDLSKGLSTRVKSGPGQMAVYGSALFGTLSGAGVANVVSTGQVTIPLMKKMGYKSSFAGGVEAAASLGGQIMPPVMASVAFLMAEFTGIPYLTVIKHALLPAICYFLAVSVIVHLEVLKHGIYKNRENIIKEIGNKKFKDILYEGWYLLFPLVILIIMLVLRYTPTYAALFSILTTIIVSWFTKDNKMGFTKIMKALSDGGKVAVIVGIACAAAGIVMGAVSLSGLGNKFSTLVITLSRGNMLLALIFTGLVTIIFGMGLPTAAAYILCVALIIPSLIKLGVATPAAHMFAIYYAVLSTITPPVAISCYAASALAEADFWDTAKQAMKLAMVAYIVPFMFIYSPGLLLMGNSTSNLIITFITAPIGILCLAFGLQGWIYSKINYINRILFLISAILLIKPGIMTDGIGIFIAIILFLANRTKYKKVNMNSKKAI